MTRKRRVQNTRPGRIFDEVVSERLSRRAVLQGVLGATIVAFLSDGKALRGASARSHSALVGFSSYASGTGTYTFTVATTIKRLSDGANLGSSYTTEFYRAEGPVTTYLYDAANLLANEIDGLGGRTTSYYDVRGDLVAESDALGRASRYQYDARRLLTRRARSAVKSSRGAP